MDGQKIKLFVDFEAPNRSELDGMANDVAIGTLAALAEGGLSPEKVKELMDQLDKLEAEGLLPPELIEIVSQLKDIQVLAESGMTPEIQSQIQEIASEMIESLTEAVKNEAIAPDLAQAIISTLDAIAEKNNLGDIVPEAMMASLEQAIKVEVIKAQIQDLIQDENGITNVPIESLLEGLSDLEGAELIDRLDQILEQLDGLEGIEDEDIRADTGFLKKYLYSHPPTALIIDRLECALLAKS